MRRIKILTSKEVYIHRRKHNYCSKVGERRSFDLASWSLSGKGYAPASLAPVEGQIGVFHTTAKPQSPPPHRIRRGGGGYVVSSCA